MFKPGRMLDIREDEHYMSPLPAYRFLPFLLSCQRHSLLMVIGKFRIYTIFIGNGVQIHSPYLLPGEADNLCSWFPSIKLTAFSCYGIQAILFYLRYSALLTIKFTFVCFKVC